MKQFNAPGLPLNNPRVVPGRALGSRSEPPTSYIYPSRLLFWPAHRLTTSTDVLTRAIGAVRDRLKVALGIGSEVYAPRPAPTPTAASSSG